MFTVFVGIFRRSWTLLDLATKNEGIIEFYM
jgi:hypothetical protein